MQLRKTCNHPYLLEYPLIPETQQYRIDEELITCCGKTLILDQMLSALKEGGHKVSFVIVYLFTRPSSATIMTNHCCASA